MTLDELITKLEAAEGPSLQLDGQIWCAVNGYEFVMWDGAGCVYRDLAAPKWDAGIKHAQASTVRPYSASVDAAIALAEKVLPDSNCWGVDKDETGSVDAHVQRNGVGHAGWAHFATHKSAPIALVLATLRALKQSEDRTE
jgi:hypothetical protein